MIPNRIKNIILTKRIPHRELFCNLHTEKYFKEIADLWEISELDIMVCNTLQRRISFTLLDKYSVIVFDNYLLELSQMFNCLSSNIDDIAFKYVYCKLMSESYFLHGNEYLTDVNKRLFERVLNKINPSFIEAINNYDHEILIVQQIFLLAHEVMHCDFRRNPYSLLEQIENLKSLIKKIEDGADRLSKMNKSEIKHIYENSSITADSKFLNKIADNNIVNSLKVNDNYMEEICCDNLAATLTLCIAIEKYGLDPKKSVFAIFKVLSTQFIIFCTDKFVENNFNSTAIQDFTNRLLILRYTILNFFRVRQSDTLDHIRFYLKTEQNDWIDSVYNKFIQFLLLQKSIRFHYENGEDVKRTLDL